LDAGGLAILPAFYNAHSHSAMVLFRGCADDLPLNRWLSEYIWPRERKLSPADVYAASRYAILEMIRSGTVFFADMYWHRAETIRAALEMGVRAAVGVTFSDGLSSDEEKNVLFLKEHALEYKGLVHLSVAAHSIYTVSAPLLVRAAALAEELNLPFQIHLSETAEEASKSLTPTNGKSPVAYLDSLNVLSPHTVAAHLLHVSDEDLCILKARGVTCVHNPCSNMKLANGTFQMRKMLANGIRVALGTDGAASNNNLDMREEMKFASLWAKAVSGDPELLPAEQVLEMATKNGAEAFSLNGGVIAEGKLADALLVSLDDSRLFPGDLVSNWVYAADSRAIDTVICDGKILMLHKKIPREEKIIEEFRRLLENK